MKLTEVFRRRRRSVLVLFIVVLIALFAQGLYLNYSREAAARRCAETLDCYAGHSAEQDEKDAETVWSPYGSPRPTIEAALK